MKIKLCQHHQSEEIFAILSNCKKDLDAQGIFQWTDKYPTLAIIENDIINESLYCGIVDNQCVGVINLSEEQEPEYSTIAWNDRAGKILVIHRLAVDPAYQGLGIAKGLMDFSEKYGRDNHYSSIRLDAYSDNERALKFYMKRKYEKRGEVFFPGRKSSFFCYEKILRD